MPEPMERPDPATPTADLCDADPSLQVCDPLFQDFGGAPRFAGPITTLKVFEDNARVRQALESAGEGRVLVIDGGGSRRCALVGGNLGRLAADNGWAGLLVYGCVRDVAELREAAVGIRALAAHPRRSIKGLHAGAADIRVVFGGVTFEPGRWLYADADGVVVEAL